MPIHPLIERKLLMIFCGLALVHGLALSWRHLTSEWQSVSATPALTVTLSSLEKVQQLALPRPTPPKLQKRTLEQTAPATQSAAPSELSEVKSAPAHAPVVSQDLKQIYLSELRAYIDRSKTYPIQARRLGQTGRVQVSFTVTAEGHIIDAKLIGPSPFQRLNEAALATVADVRRFRPIPPELGVAKLTVDVPLEYKLNR